MAQNDSVLRQDLLSGRKKIAVWGTGFIGYSTMAFMANQGVKCVGVEINDEMVRKVNNGEIPVPGLGAWLGFDVRPLVEHKLIWSTTRFKDVMSDEFVAHFIAIPTEKGDQPWDGALEDVISKIAHNIQDRKTPLLVIVESTLTPGRTDSIILPIFKKAGVVVGKDVFVGIAPRRDWFVDKDKTLKKLPRIIGGTTPETTRMMEEVLGIVVDTLLPAPDHRHAEMIKSIENAYRHMEITLANQLTLAYPHLNMIEVLRLVGTKWNIGTYQPSFGCGGYCINLSSQYVLLGTDKKNELSLLSSTLETDNSMAVRVAQSVIDRGAKRVGILGLAYKGDLKVHILSPTLKLVKYLKDHGVSVKVNDPNYTINEILNIVGCESFDFPSGLDEFDTVLIVADHREYGFVPNDEVKKHLKSCKLILDNTSIWSDMVFGSSLKYFQAGEAGWLG
jgi:nucleotide sugar dehydrogenase